MQMEPVLEKAGAVVAKGRNDIVKAIQSENKSARAVKEPRDEVIKFNLKHLSKHWNFSEVQSLCTQAQNKLKWSRRAKHWSCISMPILCMSGGNILEIWCSEITSQAILGTILEAYSLCKNYLVQKHNAIPVAEPLQISKLQWLMGQTGELWQQIICKILKSWTW